MNLRCAKCGGPIARQSGTGGRRKYCETCSPIRVRADRPRKRPLPKPADATAAAKIPEATVTNVTTATVRELSDLGIPADHYRHVLALTLAQRIDAADQETAAGLVACIRELGSLMAEIRAGAEIGRAHV